MASKFCNGKFVAILEGGYHLSTLGQIVSSVIAKMASVPYTLKIRDTRRSSSRLWRRAEHVIDEVRRVHSAFWSFEGFNSAVTL